MDYKEFETLREANPHLNEVWICDFRYDDFANKPIRHVEPTLVQVIDNSELPPGKTVYYSDFHFRPIGKNGTVTTKIIAPYDNTGFRGRTGTSVIISLTKEENIEQYILLCQTAQEGLEKHKQETLNLIDSRIAEIAKRVSSSSASLKNINLSQSL